MMVDKRNPRRKKWEHSKMRIRFYVLRASLSANIVFLIYLVYKTIV